MFKTQVSLIRFTSLLLVLFLFHGGSAVAQDDIAQDAPVLAIGLRRVTLREAPLEDAERITPLIDVQVPILGLSPSGDWYLVESEEGLGWVSTEDGEAEGDLNIIPILDLGNVYDITIFTPASAVTLYQEPNTNSDMVTEVEGEDLAILAIREQDDFYLVVYEGQSAWLAVEALEENGEIEGDLDSVPIVEIVEPEPEPCFVSTDQARAVQVRVGFGLNRGVSTFLSVETAFGVLGQNSDDDGIWYALDKEAAAPDKSITGDVVWVFAPDVEVIGDCDTVPIMEATGIIPPPPDTSDTASGEGTSDDGNRVTIIVSSQVVWVDTGTNLKTGQNFSITASGSANLCGTGNNPNCVDDPEVNRLIGPGGNLDWERCEGQYEPCQMMPGIYGALVGRIGSGAAFHIGSGGSFVADADGALVLGFNDHKFWDNTGSYTVTITVR